MTTKKDLYQHIHDLEAEIDLWTTELEYLHGFLSWMDLWDDFIFFRTSAYPKQNEDEPFSRFVL
jgi:hypothetical protein